MKLFAKIKNVKTDLHEKIDETIEKKKTPTTMLNQFMRNCESEVKKVEGMVSRQGEFKSKLYQEKEHAEYMIKKRESQIDVAAKAGEADLERRANEELIYYEEQAVKLEEMYKTAEKDETELQNQLQDMHHKLKEMHNRRLGLMAREQTALVNKRISTSMTLLSSDGSYFEAVEKQIELLEEGVHDDGAPMDYARTSFDIKMETLERKLSLEEKDNENESSD